MKTLLAVAALGTLLLTLVTSRPAQAATTEELLIRLLIQKGLVTEAEYQALKKEAEAMAAEPAPPQPTAQEAVKAPRDETREERGGDGTSLTVSVGLETEGRWRAKRDVGDRSRGASSDLFVRRGLIGLDAKVEDFLQARLALTSEWFGSQTTDQGGPADESVTIDEATIRLGREGFPLYTVVGHRTQPFGAFFSRLVTDPMSQDAYEVKQVGATVGYLPGILDADLSVTLYRGETQIDHLFESRLFDGDAVVRSTTAGLRSEHESVSSYIAALTLAPAKDLTVGAGFLSEPGDGRRNQTGALWAGYTWGPLTAEGEFMAALTREPYVLQATGERLPDAFKEKVLALGLAYKPWSPLELAARYERFWDDGLTGRAETWSARNRLSLGAGYSLYESETINVRLLGEYRFTDLRRGGAARDVAADCQHEAFLKLAIAYQ